MSAIQKRRILIVDDEPFVCDAMKMMLAFDGHLAEVARNGKEALALYEKGRFNIVMTDFSMPFMRGDELAAAIKAQDPGQAVVLVTAYGEALAMEDRPLTGVDYVMGKPFLLEDMRRAIDQVTENPGTPGPGRATD